MPTMLSVNPDKIINIMPHGAAGVHRLTRLVVGLRGDGSRVVTAPVGREWEIALVRKLSAPDVLMRYGTNIERTLNQLERQQQMRLGQPVSPVKL